MSELPILYSFRRCPYAMRARLAIAISGIKTELREVILRDKPPSMIDASPKATVPVLVLNEGHVLEESRDIMFWALEQNDPEDWLRPWREEKAETEAALTLADDKFKHHLDRYKYPGRYKEEDIDPAEQRDANLEILRKWDAQLTDTGWLMGVHRTIADMTILPFVRQFAHVDKAWFHAQEITHVQDWLSRFISSTLFQSIMHKYDQWPEGIPGVPFPEHSAT